MVPFLLPRYRSADSQHAIDQQGETHQGKADIELLDRRGLAAEKGADYLSGDEQGGQDDGRTFEASGYEFDLPMAVGVVIIGGPIGEPDGIYREGGGDYVGRVLQGVGKDCLRTGYEIGNQLDGQEGDPDGQGDFCPAQLAPQELRLISDRAIGIGHGTSKTRRRNRWAGIVTGFPFLLPKLPFQ